MFPLADNPDFKVTCGFVSKQSGAFRLKKCNFECANGGLILPLQKLVPFNFLEFLSNFLEFCPKNSRIFSIFLKYLLNKIQDIKYKTLFAVVYYQKRTANVIGGAGPPPTISATTSIFPRGSANNQQQLFSPPQPPRPL